MLLRRITDFILQGRVPAMAAAFVSVYVSLIIGGMFAAFVIGIAGIIIAAFVTLRKGAFEGVLVTAAATIPYFLIYASQYSGNNLLVYGVVVAVASNLLTFMFAVLLRQYENWSLVLDLAIVVGVIIVGMVHFAYPDIQNWWATQMIASVNKTTESLSEIQQQTSTQSYIDAVADTVAAVKPFVTGFITLIVLLSALMPVLIARWWQAVMFNPGGLRKELYQVRLSYFVGFIFVGCMALALFGNATAQDMMPVIIGSYCIAGLSLLHALLGATELWWLWLAFIYLGLIFLSFLVAIIIAFIALMDTSIDFRKRLHQY